MIALSIRQPWAWLILNAGKDIENRDWPTRFRGRFLIHASKGMTRDEYESGQCTLASIDTKLKLPRFEALERGGIVGTVELANCIEESDSPWFFGRYGFLLKEPTPMDFEPYKGQLGFFPIDLCESCGGVGGMHGVMCMADTEPPPFGAMHS